MKRLILVCAALTLAGVSTARAQTTTEHVFITVDAVTTTSSCWLKVTGIRQGEATPSYMIATFPSTEGCVGAGLCQRMALLAMAKPGQYSLTIADVGASSHQCTLTRITP